MLIYLSASVKVEVAPVHNQPTVSVDVKQHSTSSGFSTEGDFMDASAVPNFRDVCAKGDRDMALQDKCFSATAEGEMNFLQRLKKMFHHEKPIGVLSRLPQKAIKYHLKLNFIADNHWL